MAELDEDKIQLLADIAGVPNEYRQLFAEGLARRVARARGNAARAGGAEEAVPSFSPAASKQLKSLADAMAKAVKALNALEDEAASYFACAVAADQSSGLAGRTDGALRLLINDAFLMTDDPTVLANEKQKTERQARAASSAMAFSHQKTLNAIRRDDDLGSEPFNPRFTAVDWLIVDILRLVAIVQADLSVNDSYPDKGSLPKFYQALRPCLPPGFPETHSLSRLRRLKEMFSHGKI